VELLRFFDRGSGQVSPYAGDLSADTGEAEVAAAEAAIEGKPHDGPEAIANEEALAIPPVTAIPDVPIPDAAIPEPAIPEPAIRDRAVAAPRAPEQGAS